MARHITLRLGDRRWRATIDGAHLRLHDDEGVAMSFDIRERSDDHIQIAHDGVVAEGSAIRDGDRVWVWIDARLFEFTIDEGRSRRRAGAQAADALAAPMPATVLRVNVEPGARVADGDTLVVLEAMKMELSIRAPHAGTVTAIHCRAGDLVQPGSPLLEIDPE